MEVQTLDTADSANVATPKHQVFLGDGGEMGRLTRAHYWAGTSLGPPSVWPQSLRTAVRLMLTNHHPMFIWWGPDLIQFYNDAYMRTLGPERHPSALGAKGRECWAEIWDIIGPQIKLVMRGEGSTWHDDQLVPITRNGALQQVWWTYGYSPIDLGDAVGGVLVVCNDVTEQHLAKEALARSNSELLSDAVRLRELFGQAPGFIAALRGPEHVFEFTNAAYNRLIGHTDIIGKRVIDVLPEVDAQGFMTLLDSVFSSGEPYVGTGASISLQRGFGPPRQLYVDFVYQPIHNESGRVTGIFVEGYDVTARVTAENQQKLLADELRHRALQEAETSELREQFIAVLGHDLRNPLMAIDAGTKLLLAKQLDSQSANVRRWCTDPERIAVTVGRVVSSCPHSHRLRYSNHLIEGRDSDGGFALLAL
jgi:PAS domain-containing protein